MDTALLQDIDPPLPAWPATSHSAKSKSSPWHLLPFALAIGIAMNALLPSWASALSSSAKLGSLNWVSALVAALISAIVLHEAGHLIAALVMRFEILGGSLGPIRATRIHGKWAVHFSGRTFLTGSISAIPRTNECWRKRMLWVVAGGPVATLLTGLLAAFVLIIDQGNGWFNSFLGGLTQFSFFLFVLGLIPNRSDSQARNDARLFASLCRNTQEAEEILLYHLVTQLSLFGFRPRDYPERLIRRVSFAQSRPDAGSIYAYTISLWAIDRGDLVSAAAWNDRMEDLSDSCELRLRNLMLARSACFSLLFDEDPAKARDKFAEVNCEMLSPGWFMHRAKAARWLAEGNTLEALAEISRARHAFPKRLPYYEFETMLLTRINQKALATQPKQLLASRACAA